MSQLVPSKRRGPARSSEIWSYFRELRGGTIECNACGHQITLRGSCTRSSVQLWFHLGSRHKDVFAATAFYKRRQAAYSASSQAPRSTPFNRQGSRFDYAKRQVLEKLYQRQRRPSVEDRQRLAVRWNVTLASVNIWFAQRRQKDRLFSIRPINTPLTGEDQAVGTTTGEDGLSGSNKSDNPRGSLKRSLAGGATLTSTRRKGTFSKAAAIGIDEQVEADSGRHTPGHANHDDRGAMPFVQSTASTFFTPPRQHSKQNTGAFGPCGIVETIGALHFWFNYVYIPEPFVSFNLPLAG